jgi:hypothetical protein
MQGYESKVRNEVLPEVHVRTLLKVHLATFVHSKLVFINKYEGNLLLRKYIRSKVRSYVLSDATALSRAVRVHVRGQPAQARGARLLVRSIDDLRPSVRVGGGRRTSRRRALLPVAVAPSSIPLHRPDNFQLLLFILHL